MRRRAIAAARAALRALGSSPGAGALTLAVLVVVDLVTGEFAFMGHDGREAMALMMARARWHAVAEELTILATMMVIGAAFGAVGGLCGRALDWARDRPPPRSRVARGIAGALAGHAFFLARSVIEYPQLYSSRFYAPGGLTARAMVLLTTRVPVRALDAAGAVVLLALLLAPVVTAAGRGKLGEAMATLGAVIRKRRRPAAMAGSVALLAGVVLLTSGGRRPAGGAPSKQPNVLVIAVDGLRADRVYGPDTATRFPAIASLARSGVRFREAYVSQARTLPSFVTLLTGRYPQHHGIRHEFPTREARRAIGPSLPSALRDGGWRTGAVSDFAGEIFSRVPLGFEEVDAPRFDLEGIMDETMLGAHVHLLPYAATRLGERLFPAMRLMAELDDPALLDDRAIAMLDEAPGKPFFLTVFFSATHTPYVGPEPYYRRFASPTYEGPYRDLKEPLPLLPSLPPDQARQVQALYDGALLATDAAIARLLRRLDEDGLAKNTIVVLLGDHGENLFDVPGRGMGHGDHLATDIANHIPLVVVDPTHAFAPHDVGGIVRDVDLSPTLGALLGAGAPPGDGVDLAPMLRGERDSLDLDAFAETGLWLIRSGPGFTRNERLPYPEVWQITDADADGDLYLTPELEDTVVAAKHRAVRTPRWKLLYQPTPAGVRWRLFEVAVDPFQLHDVADDHPDVVAELRARLEPWTTLDGRPLSR
jgi:arylsulfatase A-like enzyme